MDKHIYFACTCCGIRYKKEEENPDGRFLIDITCVKCGNDFMLNYIGEEIEA